ncbi:MAG: tRNA preQ1(34) S-adenosylmethionine ribosyltransferase-isomerase QueA [Bacteroidetes bacterium]|nr:MAG: tRNA preQ1(34) S-adenosylmethionine ribosyltransferase-isomerase QueA [Bacteroidota bacterium]
MIKRSDFDFDLPEDNIAKYPLENRDASKLLVHRNGSSQFDNFSQIADYLDSDTLLVMNNAKVIPARLYFNRESGAAIEVLLLEPVSPGSYEESFNTVQSCQWKCIIGNSKKWREDEIIYLSENANLINARLINRENRIVELQWNDGDTFTGLLDRIGELPLPPYLNRDTEAADKQTYQTVFAKNKGSVAAPTAGLHFTAGVFEDLMKKGVNTTEVTLHVGAGTFLPVKADNVVDHDMHREHFEITLNVLNQLITAPKRITVGTTSLRVLESLYWIGVQLSKNDVSLLVNKLEPYEVQASLTYSEALTEVKNFMINSNLDKLHAATEILILPHYKLKSIVGLITNFHLPESTLLMLISSVVGNDWKEIYQEALTHNFRFLSYGDSSLLFNPTLVP